MAVLIVQPALVLFATWIAWRFLLKRLLFKDPLSTIPGPGPDSYIQGNLTKLLATDSLPVIDDLVTTYGRTFRVNGLFNESLLFLFDPKALHHILVKDTHIFEESSDFLRVNAKVFGNSLVSSVGDEHRKQRKMLNPVFSIAHMREMTPTFFRVARKLRDSVKHQAGKGGTEVDLHPWMARTALELIGQSGYGYSFDTLEPDAEEHAFTLSLRDYISTINDPMVLLARFSILPWIVNIGSPRLQRAVVNAIPWKTLHRIRDQVDVMHKTSVEIFEDAKRAVASGEDMSQRAGGGKDIMSILLKANMRAKEADKLSDEDLTAQISTLTFAAMDTTSNALSRVLHLLSEHPGVQDKLRQEIEDAFMEHANDSGDLDYDTLTSLPLLDAVCRETLRLHPPAPLVLKEAIADGILPLSTPVTTKDGQILHELFIPKGTALFLSIHQCNRDPEIWGPDALEWKPERWLSPLPASVSDAKVPGIYSHLMTFLAGHRSCIGFKFSQLEMKVVLALLVQKLKFSPGKEEVVWLNNGIMQPSTKDAPLNSAGKKELSLRLTVELA